MIQKASVLLLALSAAVSITLAASPRPGLIGTWRCTQQGEAMVLLVRDSTTLAIDGETFQYRLAPGKLQVLEEGAYADYPFSLSGDTLHLKYPDGTKISFVKATGTSAKTGPLPKSPEKAASGKTGTKSPSPGLTGKWTSQGPQGALCE